MKHISMALCCLGFAAVAASLAALRIVGSPILLMAIVCPLAMAVMLWWHGRGTHRSAETAGQEAAAPTSVDEVEVDPIPPRGIG